MSSRVQEHPIRNEIEQPREEVPADLAQVNERVGQVYKCTAIGFVGTFLAAHLSAAAGLAGRVGALLVGANALVGSLGFLAIGVALVVAIHFTSPENSAKKHALFGLFAVYEGIAISPLVLINPPAFAAAAATTVAITGGLAYLATKIETQFERYEKIMLVALVALAAASLGSVFLTGMVGEAAHTISLVGGFALFSAFVIYDTQKVRDAAALLNGQNFDVIHHTMNIYLDAMNLFIRFYERYNNNGE